MAIAIRGGSPLVVSNTGNPITGTLTGTRQPVSGDLLVILDANDYYALTNMVTPTVGGSTAGVTAITNGSADAGNPNAHVKGYTYVVGSTGDLTISETETGSGDEEKVLVLYVLSGANTSSPIDGGSSGAAGSFSATGQASFVLTGVTPSGSDAFLIYHVNSGGGSSGGTPYGPPSGFTEQYDTATGGVSYTGGTQQLAVSGATGTKTVTGNGAAISWAGVLIAIATAAGGTNAPAEQPSSTGTANSAQADLGANAAQPTATGASADPNASIALTAEQPSSTGAANASTAALAALPDTPPATGAALDTGVAITFTAEQPTATGSASDATVSTSSATNAPAEQPSATGTAPDGSVALTITAEAPVTAGSALDAVAATAPPAGQPTATGSSGDGTAALAVNAAQPTGAGSALDATVSTTSGTQAPAEQPSATGGALDAGVAITFPSGFAAATGSALDALGGFNPKPGAPSSAGTALDALIWITVNAGAATATGAGSNASASYDATNVIEGRPKVTGDALSALITL